MKVDCDRLYVEVPLVFDYAKIEPLHQEPQELIIFLHGYEQKGMTLIEKLAEACPPDAMVLAPNGPFPVPRRTSQGFRVGYSWYFHDPRDDEYLIDMRTAVRALSSAITTLGLTSISKRIIGFSQGGYLAPFLGLALENVKQVIGIGCGYLVDELPDTLNFRWDGIHGDKDEIVTREGSERSHASLKGLGVAGEFHVVHDTGHELNEEMVKTLKKVLRPIP